MLEVGRVPHLLSSLGRIQLRDCPYLVPYFLGIAAMVALISTKANSLVSSLLIKFKTLLGTEAQQSIWAAKLSSDLFLSCLMEIKK